MRRHVLLFEPRFWRPILDGSVRQTIRQPRKRPIRPEDLLSLRGWEGKAYRSPQHSLGNVTCEAVLPISIRVVEGQPLISLGVGGKYLAGEKLESFCRDDGFDSAAALAAFWREVHGLGSDPLAFWESEAEVFRGELITWR